MFVLIDNYDSFTYNLYHFLGELGAAVDVRRNDQVSVAEVMALHPQGIILSPGPCDPDRAGICLALIEAATGKLPILGVCLGHQAIGQAFGGKVIRGPVPMHGKLTAVQHRAEGISGSGAHITTLAHGRGTRLACPDSDAFQGNSVT